jgi:hypothetical protein
VVTLLKKQTGVWIDAQVWSAYRSLCSREKLRPSEPIEQYLKLILQTGSALEVSTMMQGMTKARIQGSEAYARVLLDWYKNGKVLVSVSDEGEAYVETLLLQALMDVADPQLRREMQEALVKGPGKQADGKDGNREMIAEEGPATKSELLAESEATENSERIEETEDQVTNNEVSPEEAQKIIENIREMRRNLKADEHG